MRSRLFLPALVLAAVLLAAPRPAAAQTCWVYTDNETAKVPVKCVQKNNPALSCSWPTDCTSVPASSPQTIREMHERWHQCFGSTGGDTPPAGRSQRWYSFHRQFELDFNAWRRGIGIAPIEALEWCPGMNMPVGTGPEVLSHPAGCGTGTPRPDNTACPQCVAFPHCLFFAGGGPSACPAAPSASCSTPGGGVTFPYTSLEQFKNVDEVATILDAYFHARMHTATAIADRTPAQGCDPFGSGDVSGCYNLDSFGSDCSPRDPMFWRLHHALDDVIRAWQDSKAVDVVLVVDRSGSMSEPDSSGSSKLAAALSAVDNFADLLEDSRSDGQVNRIGIVSYSDSATEEMPLTTADSSLRAAGGPIPSAITHITATGAGGCTGIGGALEKAVEMLCPPGDCRGFSANGDNDRKAILLLTDGVENVAPCLLSAGASGSSCGTQCFGGAFDLEKLEFTQLVAVGFGNGASLNGPLLTLVAERQGGIYLQNPNAPGPGNDIKDFFAKAFGQLSSEFLLLDPHGTLAAAEPASAPVEYTACNDSMLTFASGWQQDVAPGGLALLVTSPAGDLVRPGPGTGVETSRERLWDFTRVPVPYRGASAGTWRAQLVRPHRVYVNGFTPDAFAVPDEGTALVRREIQRLCPRGCARALFYEAGLRGPRSAYRDALQAESVSGTVGGVAAVSTPADFARQLAARRWDLVVAAEMGPDRRLPYDRPLARRLCAGQRAVLSDTRARARLALLECTGVRTAEPYNWRAILGDGRLADGAIKLANPGHPVFTYTVDGAGVEALSSAQRGAVAARFEPGKEQNWFVDVLGRTLAKVAPHWRTVDWKTGGDLVAEAHVPPSYNRSGGWDRVDARVEVEYPRIGVGTLLARRGLGEPRRVAGERIDARSAALAALDVPTAKATFPLADDGSGRDLYPGNGYWSGELTGLGKTDGPYKLHFLFDFTANGCTTRRELVQTVYVDVGVDPKASGVDTAGVQALPDGWRSVAVRLTPRDAAGNLLGPGRILDLACLPKGACRMDGPARDGGDGTYSFAVRTAPGLPGVRVAGLGTAFDVPLPCPDCPRLAGLAIEPGKVLNQQPARAVLKLSGPAPRNSLGGALVFLASDLKRVANVPETVLVPAGRSEVELPVTVYHVHEEPETVTVTARYGGTVQTATLTVSAPAEPGKPHHPPRLGDYHRHPDDE